MRSQEVLEMKVVIVWSSPNENGLTASAKESFLSD